MEDQNDTHTENEGAAQKGQRWVEDNLRLIISIIIVVAIAAGIYSYSQRSQEQLAFNEDTQEQILIDEESEDRMEGFLDEEDALIEDDAAEESEEAKEIVADTQEKQSAPEVTSAQTSKETNEAIIVSAQSGDGLTHLARRALADHLAKNPDSNLTAAHKIYIEDYLRKAVGHQGSVHIGTEVSFSKSLIQDAINQSKNLTESQLDNLQKYVPLVPSLS